MTRSAELVIIGGGAVGSSIAFHLAEAGREVMVVDRGAPGAGTSAATAAWVWVHTKTPSWYAALSQLSAELYPHFQKRLEAGDIEYRRTGGLQLLFTPEEVEKAKRLIEGHRKEGIEAHLLSPEETLAREPAVSPRILGATYSPLDGNVNPFRLVYSLAKAAQRRGAGYLTYAPVQGIRRERGRFVVETRAGEVEGRRLIICAGPWAAEVGRMAGVEIPTRPVRGQVLITEVLAPLVRHTIQGLRQTLNGEILFGFSHEEVGFDRRNTPKIIEATARFGVKCVPALAKVNIVRCFSGIRAMPEDGLPILGPVPEVPQLFVASMHSGITLAPLVGQVMTELLTSGETSVDLKPLSITRFARGA